MDGDGRWRIVLRVQVTTRAWGAAVFMRVHPDNAVALRSYAGAGFVPVSAAEAAAWNVGQPTQYVWLRLAPG